MKSLWNRDGKPSTGRPRKGAWIEINADARTFGVPNVAPARGRGLKLNWWRLRAMWGRSPPQGGVD